MPIKLIKESWGKYEIVKGFSQSAANLYHAIWQFYDIISSKLKIDIFAKLKKIVSVGDLYVRLVNMKLHLDKIRPRVPLIVYRSLSFKV